MKAPLDTLDTDFSQDVFGMYVVVDTTTNIEVSPVMQIRNDCVAVDSFNNLLQEQKEKKAPYSHYLLKRVGAYNCISHAVMEPVDMYEIVDESEDVENYLKLIVEDIKHKEEQ